MIIMRLFQTIAIVISSCVTCIAQESIPFAAETVGTGEQVKIVITSHLSGSIGVESPLTMSSFEHDLASGNEINLGPASPGFYSARLIFPDKSSKALLFSILPENKESKTLMVAGVINDLTEDVSGESLSAKTLKKFAQGVDKKLLKQAATDVFAKWAVENAASLGTSLTVCTVCFVPNPASPFACPVCAGDVSGQATDLTLAIAARMIEIQVDKGNLNKNEAKQFQQAIERGQFLGELLTASGKIETGLIVANKTVEIATENEGVQLTVGFLVDSVGKVQILTKVFK